MRFELTPEQKQLEQEIHAYLKTNITEELEAAIDRDVHGNSEAHRKFIKQLAADGWLGVGWPRQYGGQGRTPVEQYIFFDTTLGYYGIPLPMLGLNTVGPTLMRVGSEEQKNRFLPAILQGDLDFAIGYTEPGAGTDLASLTTKATKDGDYWVINGQKIFTTSVHHADYLWLAARTNPDAPKHRGISIFLVDVKNPGISVRPIHIMGPVRTNATFYDDVRVHKDCLVGEEGLGWRYMTNQLGLERIMLVPHSVTLRLTEDVTKWALEHKLNGARVIDQPWVRSKIVEMTVETEILRLFNYRVSMMLTQGAIPRHEPAMIKVFGTEFTNRCLANVLQITGLYGQLMIGSKHAPFRGRVARTFQHKVNVVFGGGANDAMREVVATVGLGQPRST